MRGKAVFFSTPQGEKERERESGKDGDGEKRGIREGCWRSAITLKL